MANLPPLATPEDVQELLGEDKPITDETQVEFLIRLASARARAYARSRWVTDAEPPAADTPDEVRDVVVSVVVRAMQNPTGATQETTGPFNRSFGSDAAQRIYLTAGEKDILDNNREKSRLQVISPTRGPLETPDVRDYGYGSGLDAPENDDRILAMLQDAEPAP